MNYKETTMYTPGQMVVKVTDVPGRLKQDKELCEAFIDIFEKRATRIGTFNPATNLVPELAEPTQMVRLVNRPLSDYVVTLQIPEVKDKVVTRILKKVSNLCLQGMTIASLVNEGFALMAYELSEDGETVIDAWMLSMFTFPTGLSINTEYDNSTTSPIRQRDAKPDDKEYALPLTGLMVSTEDILVKAMKLHLNTRKDAGLDTTRLYEDLGWSKEESLRKDQSNE